ncbi:MAG: Ig-like domain-containing protein [Sandaracinaceae bacterium]
MRASLIYAAALLLLTGCFQSFERSSTGAPDLGVDPTGDDAGPPPGPDLGRRDQGLPPTPDGGITGDVTLLGTTPPSPANQNRPLVLGLAEPSAEVRLYADPTCPEFLELGRGSAGADGSFAVEIAVGDNTTTAIHGLAEAEDRPPSPCSEDSLLYVEDSLPPTIPLLTGTDPISPAEDPMPEVQGQTEAEARVELYTDPDCSGELLAVTTASADGTFAVEVEVPEETTTVLYAVAIDAVGNRSGCSAGLEYRESARPEAAVLFPPLPAITNQPELTVRGRSDPAVTREVRVGGEPASTADGWATWQRAVDLEHGANALTVTVEVVDGRTFDIETVEVSFEPVSAFGLDGAALDAPRGLLYSADTQAQQLVVFDLATGRRSIQSGESVGLGDPFTAPQGVAVDSTGRIFVGDPFRRMIVEVDRVTGERTTLAGPAVGDGDSLQGLLAIAAGAGHVYALTSGFPSRILEIDPATGDRTALASYGQVVTDPLPRELAWDANADRLIFYDGRNRAVVALDTDGTDTVLSSNTVGTGPSLPFSVTSLAVDADTGLVYYTGPNGLVSDELIEVDPATGDRSEVDAPTPLGWPANSPTGMTIDGAAGIAYLATNPTGIVFSVDLTTGARSIVREDLVGIGPHLVTPSAVALQVDGESLFLADPERGGVLEVDLTTGERSVVVEDSRLSRPTGAAPDTTRVFTQNIGGRLIRYTFGSTGFQILEAGDVSAFGQSHTGLEWDPARSRLYTLLDNNALYERDVAINSRSLISGAGRGVGPLFSNAIGLAQAGDSFYVSATGNIYDVDRNTGDRSIVTGSMRGTGPFLGFALGLDVAPSGDILWAAATTGRVLEVDIASGDRIDRFGPSLGPGSLSVTDVEFGPDGEVAYVTSTRPPTLMAIDTVTVERVIVGW